MFGFTVHVDSMLSKYKKNIFSLFNFITLKVVGNEKVWGFRNVSFCPNLSQTAAIEVRFSLNFAVVFDFIYFRFRPSNAK